VIEAAGADASLFYRRLRAELQKMYTAFHQTGVPIQVTTDLSFDDYLPRVKDGSATDVTLYELQLGDLSRWQKVL
jgi:hypothetical protein